MCVILFVSLNKLRKVHGLIKNMDLATSHVLYGCEQIRLRSRSRYLVWLLGWSYYVDASGHYLHRSNGYDPFARDVLLHSLYVVICLCALCVILLLP